MAIKKTATKTKSRAQLNIDINTKTSKRNAKKINKKLKKASPVTIFVAVMLLIIGAVGGYFSCSILTKNDCFNIIGKDEITLELGENYKDEGVEVVAFGKNDVSKVVIETNLRKNEDGSYSADEIGTYYIVYKVNNLKYGSLFKVQKIRLITFVEASEDDEYTGGNA